MTSLNQQQEATIAEYTGDVVSVSRKTGEYSDESQYTGYAAIVTMSSGWTVTVGRYGAVLAEEQLPKAPTAMQVTICGPNLRDQSKGSFHVHAADCADLVRHARREPEYRNGWTVEATCKDDAVLAVYSDMIEADDCEPIDGYRADLYFFPCCDQLPQS
jgi:hypothetical protein